MLSFAGLWDEWHDVETGEAVKSFTIIVTAANKFTRQIHDRMPVVLVSGDLGTWLGGAQAADLLVPAPEDLLQMRPVSRRVNRVGNDNEPTLIDAI